MLFLRMFLSFGWRFWCNCLRFHKGILVYLHSSLFGVCGGIFTILGRPEVLIVQNMANRSLFKPSFGGCNTGRTSQGVHARSAVAL